jgi:hypothetical protein
MLLMVENGSLAKKNKLDSIRSLWNDSYRWGALALVAVTIFFLLCWLGAVI